MFRSQTGRKSERKIRGEPKGSIEICGFWYRFSRSEDITTETDESAMARPANIGGSITPNGTPIPAANGMPSRVHMSKSKLLEQQ